MPRKPTPDAKRRRTRRAPLSRERILRRAIEQADRSGIESLSMRRLAGSLGVEAMSLYNHVANKDEICDGMVDLVVSEIDVPTGAADWKAAMRRRAISAHEVLRRHPWASSLIISRVNIGPAMLRYVDATIGCLVEAGFSYEMADHAWNAIDNHIYGFTLQELNFPLEPEEYATAASQFLPLIPAETHPYMRALAELVIAGRHYGVQDFGFGLDLILDGLARLRAASGPRSGG